MFGISFEHILIAGVILILVGPKRLPELGHGMGKAIKNFKDSFGNQEKEKIAQSSAEEQSSKENPPNT